MPAPSTTRIPILHANDVYRVRQRVHTAQGPQEYFADQFVSRAHAVRSKWPTPPSGEQADLPGLSLFSGDVFNPSVESSITRGEHMICVLNAMKWDCAVNGNHDFDFGLVHLKHLMSETNFPWVLSNVVDTSGAGSLPLRPQLGEGVTQVGETLPWWTCNVQGVKVGVMGLVEQDWIATIPSFPPECKYRDMVMVAKTYSSILRSEHGCEMVIALTHSRLPNDLKLALATGCVRSSERPQDQEGDHLDLILGGHDHFYYSGKGFDSFTGAEFELQPGSETDTNAMILKSGTDFKDMSEVWLEFGVPPDAPEGTPRTILKAEVTRIQPDPVEDSRLPGLGKEIDEILAKISKATDQPVATSLTPWDCRSEKLRSEETAIGDFISDICLRAYDENLSQKFPQSDPDRRQVDVALLCGGAIRSDTLFPPGKRSIGDILEILPFDDAVVVIELDGQHLLEAFETALSKYPEQEGRFPVIGGVAIKWDSRKPPGQRVIEARLLRDGHLFVPPSASGSDAKKPVHSPYFLAPEATATTMSELGTKWTVYHSGLNLGPTISTKETYRVVSRAYMVQGYDGFQVLTNGKMLIDDENGGLMMSQLVRKYLLGCSYLLRMRTLRAKYPETPAASTPSRAPTRSSSAQNLSSQSSQSLTSATPTRPESGVQPSAGKFPDKADASEQGQSLGASLQNLRPGKEQPHRPRTPHHGFPVTSRASQALERWLHLQPPANGREEGSSQLMQESVSDRDTETTHGLDDVTKETAPSSKQAVPVPPALVEQGRKLWDHLRQAVVDNSSSGMRHALYIADAEEHDDPVSRLFASRSHDPGLKQCASQNGKTPQEATLQKPIEATATSPRNSDAPEGKDLKDARGNVLTQSVSLDKYAAADLTDSEADADLPVVAPLKDGRLVDVARGEASW